MKKTPQELLHHIVMGYALNVEKLKQRVRDAEDELRRSNEALTDAAEDLARWQDARVSHD